jgi:hypothetical protein
MGTRFTHFNPLSDENGLGLQERFHERVNNSIKVETDNVYCIFIGDDDKCHKYNINNTKAAELIKDYTALKLFKYIFGDVFKRYIDSLEYKNMSEEDLLQICADFAEHLKTSGNVLIKNAEDVERERFSAKYPNNAYAKYADPTKVWFSRIIDADTRKTNYFYFPIQLEEDGKRYHIVLKHHEFKDIQLAYFNPFSVNLQSSANAILKELEKESSCRANCCMLHIKESKITIEFCEDQTSFVFTLSPKQFYRMLFGKIYKDYIEDELYQNMTDEELSKICTDFEAYLEYFKTNEIVPEETNKKKYMFHVMFPENVFARSIIDRKCTDKSTTYMCKIFGDKSRKIKYHYLPLEIIAGGRTYNVMVSMN